MPDLTTDDAAEGVYKVRLMRGEEEQRKQSRLGQALETLDNVLMKDVNEITSDMNRTMYLVFNRMCFCYVRWRRHYMNRAQPHDEINLSFQNFVSIKAMAASLKKKSAHQSQGSQDKHFPERKFAAAVSQSVKAQTQIDAVNAAIAADGSEG